MDQLNEKVKLKDLCYLQDHNMQIKDQVCIKENCVDRKSCLYCRIEENGKHKNHSAILITKWIECIAAIPKPNDIILSYEKQVQELMKKIQKEILIKINSLLENRQFFTHYISNSQELKKISGDLTKIDHSTLDSNEVDKLTQLLHLYQADKLIDDSFNDATKSIEIQEVSTFVLNKLFNMEVQLFKNIPQPNELEIKEINYFYNNNNNKQQQLQQLNDDEGLLFQKELEFAYQRIEEQKQESLIYEEDIKDKTEEIKELYKQIQQNQQTFKDQNQALIEVLESKNKEIQLLKNKLQQKLSECDLLNQKNQDEGEKIENLINLKLIDGNELIKIILSRSVYFTSDKIVEKQIIQLKELICDNFCQNSDTKYQKDVSQQLTDVITEINQAFGL